MGNQGPTSPVLIDVEGDGFHLTDKSGGVAFDLDSNGIGSGSHQGERMTTIVTMNEEA